MSGINSLSDLPGYMARNFWPVQRQKSRQCKMLFSQYVYC